MNEFEKSSKKDVTAVNKRRNFLKKTATGAVIVSLPAKSVWGACSVSGSMSGNLSQNTDRHDCEMPDFRNGRSPGSWKNWDNNMHDTFLSLKSERQRLGHRSDAYAAVKTCYVDEIEAAMGHEMTLASELNAENMTVAQGLASNGSHGNLYYHLAAVYLNSYFGFYDGFLGRRSALDAITQVMLYAMTAGSIHDSQLGYDEGQTTWTARNC